ncbi:MAG: MFS transporter [Fimbriimonas sp.]
MRYRDILSIAAFRSFWIGQTISLIGDAFYYVVFMFMVGKLTGSAAMVGFVGAVETIPFLLLSPYAGIIADRIDRRKILLATAIASGGLLTVFAILVLTVQPLPIWTLFVTAGLTSVVTTFLLPAKNAAVPALVPQDKLLTANALNSVSTNLTPVFAHTLTATVLTILYGLSPTIFFASIVGINAVSFFISAAFFFRMPSIIPDRTEMPHAGEDLKQGFLYLRSRGDLKALLWLTGALHLFLSPFFVVYIQTNNTWFTGHPRDLALVEGSFFLAMTLCSLLVGRLHINRPGLSYGFSILVVGATIACMGFSRTVPLYIGWNLLCGFALPFAQIPMQTYLQISVPDGLRGRVNSVLGMVYMGVMPIGLGLGGLMIDHIGLVTSYLVMGGGMASAGLLAFILPEFRRAVIPAEAMPEGTAALS